MNLAVCALLLLAAVSRARAQDATWNANPGSPNFNTTANWTPAQVPTGTATFGASTVTSLTFSANTNVNTMSFAAGAPAYAFTNGNGFTLQFLGSGVLNNSSNRPTFTNNDFMLNFLNSSKAGNAEIINSGSLTFRNASTADNAIITNNARMFFFDSATAGTATIMNNGGSSLGDIFIFLNSSTAGSATIINNQTADFSNSSSAQNATIINNRILNFFDTATADRATIITNGGATTSFLQNATGGLARIITNAGGTFDLSGMTSARLTVGSIEGAGNYYLGSNQLTVGRNNLSTTVSGVISDCGPSGMDCINAGATGGSLVKVGTGTLVLSGTNMYTGGTTVNSGTLFVNGSIANSAVTVNAGATLAGIGTVGATTINSGGIFAPGTSPGTITVQGNLAFQSGAIYLVQVNPSTASSTNVTAGGSATLAGTVNAAFAAGSYVSRTYTILSAAGGLNSTTFNTLTTSNLPVGFTASLSYTATDAILNLTATLGQPSGPSALGTTGLNVNQLNVVNSLNGFFNNGGALPLPFVSIFGLTGSNLANALSQLSGEAATGAQKVAFQLADQFLGLMLDPFVDGRSGVGGADHSALGFAPERETMPPEIALAYTSVFKERRAPLPPIYEPRWTVWGGAYGGSNRTTGDIAVTGSHDLSASTAGFAGGFDYHLSRDSVVGLALAGSGTNWNLAHGLGGGKSDAFQAGLYGATKYGPAYLAAAFAFANHWMSTDRIAFANDHLTANFNAQSYGGRLEGGYRFATVYGGITPYAAIQAQSFHTPGYSESASVANGFALTFNGRDATDTRSELGARFDRVVALYTNGVLALRGRVAWAHDWVSEPTLTPLFQTLSGASFIVNGATPAKNSALASAGAEYRLADGVTLLAKFDGEFASHSSTYAGTGALRYRW
jgi:outer membrane autotransporter protein